LNTKIDSRFDAIATTIQIGVISSLNNLTDATSEPKIADAVNTGICRSLNGRGCPGTPGVPNPTQGLKGMQNDLGSKIAQGFD
ncbi:hypothetical protein, partial [Pseudomonas aeruginosa]|uniref:hypothetical protein n=1 Tax=Pseudomonas aeruginosa TaxID=287 RepID=UPI001E39D2B1